MARKRRGRTEPNERPARVPSGRTTQAAVANARSSSGTDWKNWAWAAVAPLLAVVVFAQVARFDLLQYDDTVNVTGNPHLNPVTMSRMDRLYGVTMAEPGVSRVVSVKVNERAQPRTEVMAARPPRNAVAEGPRERDDSLAEEATSQVA